MRLNLLLGFFFQEDLETDYAFNNAEAHDGWNLIFFLYFCSSFVKVTISSFGASSDTEFFTFTLTANIESMAMLFALNLGGRQNPVV